MQKDLTTGSVFKNVLYFSLPYLLSYFLQTLYGMADLFIIGQFEGTASITAVSIGSQIMHMITVMLVGLAIVLVRVPGAYFMSKLFPDNLLPMGLATAVGSLLSVLICLTAYLLLKRKGTFGGKAA